MPISSGVDMTTQNFISTVDLLHMPDVYGELIYRYGETNLRGISSDLQMLVGRALPVENREFHHHEEGHVIDTLRVNANVLDPGAGNPATFTIPAADHLNSGTYSYARVRDKVLLPNNVEAIIIDVDTTTPSAHTVTIEPVDATQNIGALTAGMEIAVTGNAHAEGSDQPEGRVTIPEKVVGQVQIIKEAYEVTSSEMTNKAWIKVKDKNGNLKQYWYYKGERDTYLRFLYQIDMQLLTSTYGETADPVSGKPVYHTRGLVPFIREEGANYVAAGWNLASFDTLILESEANFAENENILYTGLELGLTFDNLLTDQMKDDAINYASFSPFGSNQDMGKDKAIKLGFSAFKKGNYCFYFKILRTFSNSKTIGATGYNFPNTALMIPSGMGKDPKTGSKQYFLQMRYKAGNGMSRKMEFWETGGGTGNAVKTNGIDATKFNYRCELGLQQMAGNKFAIIE